MIDYSYLETNAGEGLEGTDAAMLKGSAAGKRKLITLRSSSGIPKPTGVVVRVSATLVGVPGCALPSSPLPSLLPFPFLAKPTALEHKEGRGSKGGLLVHPTARQLIVYVQMQRLSLRFCLQIANNFNLWGLAHTGLLGKYLPDASTMPRAWSPFPCPPQSAPSEKFFWRSQEAT